jgi:ketosteroid isomerase-like protein
MKNLTAFVDRLLEAIRRGDRRALESMHRPTRTKWHNSDGIARPGTIDETLMMPELLDDLELEARRVIPIDGGFVLQFEARGRIKRTGGPFVTRSCVIADWVDGKIGDTDEYIDSAAFSELFP